MHKENGENRGCMGNCAKKSLILVILVALAATLGVPAALEAKNTGSILNYSLPSQNKANFVRIESKITSARDVRSRAEPKKDTNKPNMVVRAVLTAYTSTIDQCDDTPFISANGAYVYDGMVAANWLPFGTKVKIPSIYGDKIFTVEDRMNERYGYGRMDVWLDTPRSEAIKFGVKVADVEVYYPSYQLVVNK